VRYLLVDRIEEITPGVSARAWKTVAMSEDYLEWHFPERPILPGTLVLEACTQLAGWHEAVASGFLRWFFLDHVTSARYFGFSVPGDRVELSLEVVASADPARRAFRCEAVVAGTRRAAVEFEGTTTPLSALDDRARIERLYKALRGDVPQRDARPGRA
jgi:3-hydroxyacyl-[acyl-carrier-protein] dehydratase